MEKWVTTSEASRLLDVTERTIQRHIKEGKYQSKLEDARRYVLIELSDDAPTNDGQLVVTLQSEVEYLRSELSEVRRDAVGEKERSDTIILQLTKQLENQTLMLEDTRKEAAVLSQSETFRSERSLWRRVKMLFVPAQ